MVRIMSRGFSVWSLDILPVDSLVTPSYTSFQSPNTCIWTIGEVETLK